MALLLFFPIYFVVIINNQLMSEIPVPINTPKIENLSFQLILINFHASSSIIQQGGNLKFSVNRGKQTFQETKKIAMQASNGVIPLNRARLNFMVFSYDAAKTYDFQLRLHQSLMGEQKCIGECLIDCKSYAQMFLNSGNGAFQQMLYLSPEQKIEVQLYVEKNRFALEKLVREMTGPKSKSMIQSDAHNFQRITDKPFTFGRQLSSSPKRSRQNPYKRNSPKKTREEEIASPRIRQQFLKQQQPAIKITSHYSVLSSRSENANIEPTIEKLQISPSTIPKQQGTSQAVIEQTEITAKPLSESIPQPTPNHVDDLPHAQEQKQVIRAQQIGLKQLQIIDQAEPVQIQAAPQVESHDAPLNNSGQITIALPQEQQEILIIQETPASVEASHETEFKIGEAANLIKTELSNIPIQEEPSINRNINKTLEDTDKPTLHSINNETIEKIQAESANQIQAYEPYTQNKFVIKRESIFKRMPLKFKILLGVLLFVFMIASNYVQEQDHQLVHSFEQPLNNTTISNLSADTSETTLKIKSKGKSKKGSPKIEKQVKAKMDPNIKVKKWKDHKSK